MVPNVLSHPSLSIYIRKKIREKDVTAYMVEAANPPSSRSLALWPSKRLRWRPVAVVQRWSFKLELVAVTKTLKLGGLATMMGIVKLEDCGAGEEYAHLPPLWPDPPLPAASSKWPLVAPSRSSSGSIGHMSRVFTACPKRARDLPLLPFMSELELGFFLHLQPPPSWTSGQATMPRHICPITSSSESLPAIVPSFQAACHATPSPPISVIVVTSFALATGTIVTLAPSP